MALLNFINMGGPINWILFAILCFCICQCIERSIYFIITSKNHKKSCMTRIKNKSQQIKNLDKKSKQRELVKEFPSIVSKIAFKPKTISLNEANFQFARTSLSQFKELLLVFQEQPFLLLQFFLHKRKLQYLHKKFQLY